LIRRLLKPPWVCVLAALLLRVALIAALGTYHKDPSEGQIHFGYETGRVARSIVLGQGISSPFHDPSGPTGILMPLFPYLLAGVFRLFGIYTDASGFVILTLCSLFSALTCAVVFSIGELTFGRTVANISAWTWAFHPVAVFISVIRIWETTLATLLLTLLVLVTLRLERDTRLWMWFGYGVLWGLTALSNPTVVAVLPFWGAWLWYRVRRQGASPERFVALAAVAFVLSVSPWFIRNYRVFHHFIPFRTNFGLELQIGNNTRATGEQIHDLHPIHDPGEFERYRRMGEVEYMAAKKREAFQFIASHPCTFVRLTLTRIAFWWTFIWQIPGGTRLGAFAAALGLFGFGMQSFLAFVGLTLAFRSGKPVALPFAALFLFFPLVYYITFAQLRFRHPIEPVMVILCVYALRKVFFGERADEVAASPSSA